MSARMGRPAGSLDATARTQRVALDELAAVRAYIQGVRPQNACERYLAREEPPTGESPALARLAAIIDAIAQAASARVGEEHDSAVQLLRDRAQEARERRVALLRTASKEHAPEAAPGSAGDLPEHLQSLEAFEEWYVGEREDPGFSETQWQQTLQAAIEAWRADERRAAPSPALAAPLGALATVRLLDHASRERPPITAAEASLRALERCRFAVSLQPQPADLVGAWFTQNTARRLRAADLPTLYSLVDLANRRGRTWWRAVTGLGPVRAGRVNAWLQSVGVEAGLPLRTDLTASIAQVHAREREALMRIPQFDQLAAMRLEPLALALHQGESAGASGAFQLANNMLGATDDIEALIIALEKYADSPLTQRLYAVEITRFVLWCWRELRKPVSGVTVQDARAYRAFLARIPGEWINPDRVPRTARAWRPFRGQLGQSSQRKALTAVGIVMGQLQQTGYLMGNPFAGSVKAAKLPAPTVNVTRSFTREQWNLVLEMLDREPGARRLAAIERLARSNPALAQGLERLEYAKARRLKALVRLVGDTGVRRVELHTARLGALSLDAVEDEWLLRVTGKRGKVREVFVPREILDLVREHLADRPLAGFRDDLDTQAGRERIPLISALSPAPGAHGGALVPLEESEQTADSCGALSAGAIYRILKRFFERVGVEAQRRGMERDRFTAASTHWLRHTFGTLNANDGVDSRLLQEALGHSSPATTALYTKMSTREMIRGLKAAHDARDEEAKAQSAC